MSFRKISLLAGFALLALAAPAAKAGIMIQTFTHVSQQVPYSFNFAANQFNPTNGALTSVSIAVTTNIVAQVQVVNYNTTAQLFTNATASVPVTLTGPNGLTLSTTATTPGASGTVAAGTGPGFGPFPTSTPGVTTIPGQTATMSTSTTIVDPLLLASYTGTGMSNLNFMFSAGQGIYTGSAASNVFFGGSANADANITITYNFTPAVVPEPASLALVALGLGGVFGARRLRRRAV